MNFLCLNTVEEGQELVKSSKILILSNSFFFFFSILSIWTFKYWSGRNLSMDIREAWVRSGRDNSISAQGDRVGDF